MPVIYRLHPRKPCRISAGAMLSMSRVHVNVSVWFFCVCTQKIGWWFQGCVLPKEMYLCIFLIPTGQPNHQKDTPPQKKNYQRTPPREPHFGVILGAYSWHCPSLGSIKGIAIAHGLLLGASYTFYHVTLLFWPELPRLRLSALFGVSHPYDGNDLWVTASQECPHTREGQAQPPGGAYKCHWKRESVKCR